LFPSIVSFAGDGFPSMVYFSVFLLCCLRLVACVSFIGTDLSKRSDVCATGWASARRAFGENRGGKAAIRGIENEDRGIALEDPIRQMRKKHSISE
jgi:hypothetical protein